MMPFSLYVDIALLIKQKKYDTGTGKSCHPRVK